MNVKLLINEVLKDKLLCFLMLFIVISTPVSIYVVYDLFFRPSPIPEFMGVKLCEKWDGERYDSFLAFGKPSVLSNEAGQVYHIMSTSAEVTLGEVVKAIESKYGVKMWSDTNRVGHVSCRYFDRADNSISVWTNDERGCIVSLNHHRLHDEYWKRNGERITAAANAMLKKSLEELAGQTNQTGNVSSPGTASRFQE